MEHDFIVITSHGEIINTVKTYHPQSPTLRQLYSEINKQKLKPSRIFMSEQDYKDILGWANEYGT